MLPVGWGSADLGVAQLGGLASGCDRWAALLLFVGVNPTESSLFHMSLVLLGPIGLPGQVCFFLNFLLEYS